MTTAPWYVNKWRDQADNAMQEHSDNGTAINFGYWTTLLVNGEATFMTDAASRVLRGSQVHLLVAVVQLPGAVLKFVNLMRLLASLLIGG